MKSPMAFCQKEIALIILVILTYVILKNDNLLKTLMLEYEFLIVFSLFKVLGKL